MKSNQKTPHRNSLRVRSSQFAVRSSQFAVRSSQFAVRSSQFAVRSSQFAVRSSQFAVLLFLAMQVIGIRGNAQDVKKALAKEDKQFFIENKGQWPQEVLFLTKQKGLNAWITKTGVVYDFYKMKYENTAQKRTSSSEDKNNMPTSKTGQVVRLNMEGVSASMKNSGEQKSTSYFNYLLGNDKTKWVSNVALYKEAKLENIYTGIDQRFYFDEGSIRYDYIVKPTGNINDLKFNIEGSDKNTINDKGELVFTTQFGDVKQAKLFTYQEIEGKKVKVESKFEANKEGGFGFKVENYDASKPLIIDPILYSTFIGSTEQDAPGAIAKDAQNNIYIAGRTWSANYPVITGNYNNASQYFMGWQDGVVSEINTNLSGVSSLVASTFIGGSGFEELKGIDIDPISHDIFVVGNSHSIDYPTTPNAASLVNSSLLCASIPYANDVIVSVFSANLVTLKYSTYFGGKTDDYGNGIKVAGANSFIITGYTLSTQQCNTTANNFPVTVGVVNTSSIGGIDAFVSKMTFNAAFTTLNFSTYYGGTGDEYTNGLDVDNAGNIYIVGTSITNATNTAPGVLYGAYTPGKNIFVTKFNPTCTSVLYSYHIGSAFAGNSIAVNKTTGEAYFCGTSWGANFPTAINSFTGGINDAIVGKVVATGTTITSRYIGGNNVDEAYKIKFSNNKLYIVGTSSSTDYPHEICTPFKGNFDAIVTVLNTSLNTNSIVYSTFIGGVNSFDFGMDIEADAAGIVYIAGITFVNSNSIICDFPITPNAYDQTYNSFIVSNSGIEVGDIFLTKFSLDICCQAAPAGATLLPTNPVASAQYPTNNFPTTPIVIDGTFTIDQNLDIIGNLDIYLTPPTQKLY